MLNSKTKIYIIALASHGNGISGGDRIYIEFAKRWSDKFPITVYQDIEGNEMFRRQGLAATIEYKVFETKGKYLGFFANYIARIILGLKIGITLQIANIPSTYVYSASEFWMDSLPCFILKIRYPNITWIATWFQTAPNPIKGFAEGKRIGETYRLTALFYWLSQLPIKPLVSRFSAFVLVNNELEKKHFPSLNNKGKALVVLGAVDIEQINVWRKKHSLTKKYDAVYQGRFHPQKGVVELIDIWKKVVREKKDASLVMIGDGPLMEEVKKRIKFHGLEKNILLQGYVFDGDEKYTLFAESKLVLHPALYDSGGMAAAEAMAFGLACVGFDLPSYQSYYPKGMVKVPIDDLDIFAKTIVELLNDPEKSKRFSSEGLEMLQKNWSWDKRANDILIELINKNVV